MLSKYKTIHILLTNVHLGCKGEGSSNRNASRDESVETRAESIEAGEKTQQSCYKQKPNIIITAPADVLEPSGPASRHIIDYKFAVFW